MKKKPITKSKTPGQLSPLWDEIKKAIIEHPDQFDMRDWFTKELKLWLPDETYLAAGGCGTAACLAGWALHLDSQRRRIATTAKSFERRLVDARAAEVLKLNLRERVSLFYLSEWPEPFDVECHRATTPLQRARVAVRRIDHFIETGE